MSERSGIGPCDEKTTKGVKMFRFVIPVLRVNNSIALEVFQTAGSILGFYL